MYIQSTFNQVLSFLIEGDRRYSFQTPHLSARPPRWYIISPPFTVHEVVISCGSEVIARHRRSYQRDDFIFDPLHYLPLLEHKTGALDQAAPLAGWELPEEFAVLRRVLESRLGKQGKREFVQVLRLMEDFRREEVHKAVRDALRLGAVSYDAVKHLVLCKIEGRPPRLEMELYPYLPRANVAKTSSRDYMTLLAASRS